MHDKRFRRFPMSQIREQEFYATARRLHDERIAAPRLVDAALRLTPPERWHELLTRPDLLSCGAIEHLERLLNAEMTRDPKRSESLARLALALALALPADNYPAITLAQIKATAWKDVGKILSYLSRHEQANDAFTEAERCLDPFMALTRDRAVIALNRAINYQESDRPQEALTLLLWCKQIFREHADFDLFILSGFYEGRVQQHLRHYREARETYLLLIASSTSIPKPTLAAIHQSIGLCSIELKDYRAAEDNLAKAIQLHTELDQPLDAVKGDHGRGILLLRQGNAKNAFAVLRPVRHQYLKHSLAEEAGLAGLLMVEALLLESEAEKAERLARTIMNEFLAASLNTRAMTALGYLTEAIANRKASPKHASHVYQYVLSLRTEPEREFTKLHPTDAD